MFKRLSKSRRHSADDVALSLSNVAVLEELSGNPISRDFDNNVHDLNAAGLLRISRSKYTRRSCGDAAAMQTLLGQGDEQDVIAEADYQTVTAVPAFIVEHEPGKQRASGLGIWGRRMGKKIDSFRLTRSRDAICSIAEKSDGSNRMINNNNNNNINNNDNGADNGGMNNSSVDIHQLSKLHLDERTNGKLSGICHRSPSPFKSFFIRMGSTGMLNSTRAIRRSQNVEERLKMPDKEGLFRSCSTSQLNSSPTYVKGDDPSEGIDLQIAARKDKTVSCDDLASGHRNMDRRIFDARGARRDSACVPAYPLGSPSVSFSTCDLDVRAKAENGSSFMRKSSSCDLKEAKKSNFPYAFLRSKLSVLPEERNGSLVTKDERLFKTASEEHFPALKIEDLYVTTLGRRKPRIGNGLATIDSARNRENVKMRLNRSSYAEHQRNSRGHESDDVYGRVGTGRLEGDLRQPSDNIATDHRGYGLQLNGSALSLRESGEFQQDKDGRTIESGVAESNGDLDVTTAIRSNRRNSASSSCEQRLSSHYVSSNESGYDSDGPRGESVAASENELLSLKGSSDTSSVVDSEAEKPARSSTPNQDASGKTARQNPADGETGTNGTSSMNIETIDGLTWHQSGSGRMLPSIHGMSFDEEAVSRLKGSRLLPSACDDRLGLTSSPKMPDVSAHRARLQRDKTRFLSDIIQPLTRVRRCCLIQLRKGDPKDSLGIRLAQQRLGDPRYIVVQLENNGIAQRDGRLRLGDEIVEIEGKELRTMESLEDVQEYLKSFTGNTICLTTAYEETVPQMYDNDPPLILSSEYEYLENAKNLSSMSSLIDDEANRGSSVERRTKFETNTIEPVQSRKRPNFLLLSRSSRDQKDADSNPEPAIEPHHYLTRHVTRFEKGYGKPSLGFSVVGGRDSPRGDMGIFVRRVFPGGQADTSRSLFQGDEIVSLNGKVLKGRTHQEVIELFKTVKEGVVELEITRRHRYSRSILKSAPY